METVSHWLKERCKREGLSLRQVEARAGISRSTVAAIIKGNRPSPGTIQKLAQDFDRSGSTALQDHLLALAGYRTEQPEDGQPAYLKQIPLLHPEHRHIIEVLVTELAKVDQLVE